MKKITLLFLLAITNLCLAGIPIDSVNAWKRQADKLKTDLNTYETIRIYAKAKSLTGIPIDSVNAWKQQAAKDKIDLNTYITGLILLTPAGTSGVITGTLTTNYIPVATGTNSIGNSIIYENSGNIGIGVINPLAKLDVYGDLFVRNILQVNRHGYSTIRALWINANSNDDVEFQTQNADLIFKTKSSGTIETLRFTNTGAFKMANSTIMILGSYNTVTDNYGYISSAGNISNGVGLKFEVAANSGTGSGVTAMQINAGGNVGIGAISPTSKLQVVGLNEYADNASALLAGLTVGAFYRTGDILKVVH